MSIKKILILSAAGSIAVSSLTWAGGPDKMLQPQSTAQSPVTQDTSSLFSPAFYMDIDGGYAFQNWGAFTRSDVTIFGDPALGRGYGITDNSYGGGTGLVDMGFQLFPHISVEAGGIYLPKVTGPQLTYSGPGTSSNQYNWAVYAAGKFSVNVPHVTGLSIFTKIGPVWRAMSNVGFVVPGFAGPHSYWTAIYGAGLQYVFSTDGQSSMLTGFSANLQWLGIPGSSGGNLGDNNDLATFQPMDNLLVAGLGYQFAL